MNHTFSISTQSLSRVTFSIAYNWYYLTYRPLIRFNVYRTPTRCVFPWTLRVTEKARHPCENGKRLTPAILFYFASCLIRVGRAKAKNVKKKYSKIRFKYKQPTQRWATCDSLGLWYEKLFASARFFCAPSKSRINLQFHYEFTFFVCSAQNVADRGLKNAALIAVGRCPTFREYITQHDTMDKKYILVAFW